MKKATFIIAAALLFALCWRAAKREDADGYVYAGDVRTSYSISEFRPVPKAAESQGRAGEALVSMGYNVAGGRAETEENDKLAIRRNSPGEDAELWRIDGPEEIKIDDGIISHCYNASRDAIAYMARNRNGLVDSILVKLYACSGGGVKIVAAETAGDGAGFACMSPGGDVLIYKPRAGAGYVLWQNGGLESLPAGIRPIAVSGGREYMYYWELGEDGMFSLRVLAGGKEGLLFPGVPGGMVGVYERNMLFSPDYSEAVVALHAPGLVAEP